MKCSLQQICKALEEKHSVKIYIPILHQFGDVVLNDNTSATNHYEMALLLFLQIKKATSEAIPYVIFTDADPALLAVIQEEFPMTNALHCMFHIAQNLPLNLKNSLRDHYDKFIKDFFDLQQSSFITIFEYKWKHLIKKYNDEHVVSYLQQVLYAIKETWAKAFVLKLFTAGMISTSQVKSYNSKIKRLIFNSNTILLELADKLSLCILEEDKKTEYALFCASIPSRDS
ncbi:21920_t:CDS:2 [Gigaspora margarita]|uniref:21920_t:CDS:1 n=1 Tax=Gigaspora margarita TaxID=4874 RepID=A0ABN7W9B6_GIGMA|nr:21920_t:CDS:2 [Gigaspora margarita]